MAEMFSLEQIELLNFYNERVGPVVQDSSRWETRFPIVRDNALETSQMIMARYGRFPQGETILLREPSSAIHADQWVPFSCLVRNGQPIIQQWVGDIKGIFDELAAMASSLAEAMEIFDRFLMLSIMHESDHLGLGTVDVGNQKKYVANEVRTWGRTCEKTLYPLLEIYQVAMRIPEVELYKNWVAFGRNVNSPKWREYIAATRTTF